MTCDVQRNRTQHVELPHNVDQKRHFINPATFYGITNWNYFKSHFKVCAELNCWSVIKKEMYLAVFLTGNVQGVLGNLPLNDQHNTMCYVQHYSKGLHLQNKPNRIVNKT